MRSPVLIPDAVKDLKLGQAFKGYNPSIFDCIEVLKEECVKIVDNGYMHITNDSSDEYRCCQVLNPLHKELVILSLDHNLIKQKEGGMADGAVFNINKFAFIEFKDQAEGKTEYSVQATYDKASDQLKSAYSLFQQKTEAIGFPLNKKRDVVCHIIVSETFPRFGAREQAMMMAFAQDTNGIELKFEREIEFK